MTRGEGVADASVREYPCPSIKATVSIAHSTTWDLALLQLEVHYLPRLRFPPDQLLLDLLLNARMQA
jgi:hypothetical protein